jgi:hypothetical protein
MSNWQISSRKKASHLHRLPDSEAFPFPEKPETYRQILKEAIAAGHCSQAAKRTRRVGEELRSAMLIRLFDIAGPTLLR